jgi:uncharacterized protein (TIGR00725 family)
MSTPPYVAVIGASNATEWELASAERMGQLLAEAGCVLVCGGLGGVMDAAARGSAAGGGISIGRITTATRRRGRYPSRSRPDSGRRGT